MSNNRETSAELTTDDYAYRLLDHWILERRLTQLARSNLWWLSREEVLKLRLAEMKNAMPVSARHDRRYAAVRS